MSDYVLDIPREELAKLFVNNRDPDLTLHPAASDLGRRCLAITHSGVPRLKLVNVNPLYTGSQ